MTRKGTGQEEFKAARMERLAARKAEIAAMRNSNSLDNIVGNRGRRGGPQTESSAAEKLEESPELNLSPSPRAVINDPNLSAVSIAKAMRDKFLTGENPIISVVDAAIDAALTIETSIPSTESAPPQPEPSKELQETIPAPLLALLPEIRKVAIKRILNGDLDKFLCSLLVEVANADSQESH